MRNCLFAREETDLRGPLRGGATTRSSPTPGARRCGRKRPGHGIDDPTFLQPDRPMSRDRRLSATVLLTVRYFAGARAAAGVPRRPIEAATLGELEAAHDGRAARRRLAAVLTACSFLVDGVVLARPRRGRCRPRRRSTSCHRSRAAEARVHGDFSWFVVLLIVA